MHGHNEVFNFKPNIFQSPKQSLIGGSRRTIYIKL